MSISARLIILVFVAAVPGVLPSVSALAQGGDLPARIAPNPDDRILNAPYSARRRVTSVEKLADGTINRREATDSVARDSQCRTYHTGERQWTYLEGQKKIFKSEMLYRIHDPVTETDTKWDSTTKEVKVIHWPKRAPDQNSSEAPCQPCFDPTMTPFGTAVEKLGAKTLSGVVAEGTRNSYTVPSGQGTSAAPIVVVHESWYCPDLKMVILETNDDPRRSYRDELVDIILGEPDLSTYHPPKDYVRHEVQVPR